ncbi:MAG: hypothetical protein QOI77_3331 [Blastocatellia bacterium]|nr:hypothetical protein [Blastocatellia bacterium]
MRRRSPAIFLLVGAFLLGAWGNVVTAAFCPRYRLNRDCCVKQTRPKSKQVERTSSCHHEMAGMQMGDMQRENESPFESGAEPLAKDSPVLTPEASSKESAFDLPVEACVHCLIHSQTVAGTVTVIAVDPSKRLSETNAAAASFEVALPAAFSISITPFEHGPPGASVPRHVLINVFQI